MAGEVEGLAELTRRLNALELSLSTKVLRAAMRRAVRPTINKMKSAAPKGRVAHRTYRGRLVAPGFLSRSVKARTKIDRQAGSASVIIGVLKEAWYGTLYDTGPHQVTATRWNSSRGRSSTGNRKEYGRNKRGGRRSYNRQIVRVSPYTIRRVPWFSSVFKSDRSALIQRLAKELRQGIDKAVKQ